MRDFPWIVFLSGRGSTAQALFDLSEEIEIVGIVTNKLQAGGVGRARRTGVAVLGFNSDPKAKFFWDLCSDFFSKHKPFHIFLLGFMRVLPPPFLRMCQGKVWNIHPSLLPEFSGLHALEQAWKKFAGAPAQELLPKVAAYGVTVHEVVAEVDAGPHLMQSRFAHQIPNRGDGKGWSFPHLRFLLAVREQNLIRECYWRQGRKLAKQGVKSWK